MVRSAGVLQQPHTGISAGCSSSPAWPQRSLSSSTSPCSSTGSAMSSGWQNPTPGVCR
uniref:Uncharacterized protein n=1 Tax=Arundo donax TaxID=35708 RepID=A0A0A9BV89_ARUDO